MSEYEQLSKGQSRVAYTKRIMEIIANIHKQKEDIGRILADTRKVVCVCVCNPCVSTCRTHTYNVPPHVYYTDPIVYVVSA